MTVSKRFISLLAVFLFAAECGRGKELVPIPPLRGRVNDLSSVLSKAEKKNLTAKLAAFEKRTGAQVAVLILPTTGLDPIEEFSLQTAKAWKLGRKGINDGVLLTVARDDRKLRMEVGLGLTKVLTDARAKSIIDGIIVPRFKRNQFYEGIDGGLNAIIATLDGRSPASSRRDMTPSRSASRFPASPAVASGKKSKSSSAGVKKRASRDLSYRQDPYYRYSLYFALGLFIVILAFARLVGPATSAFFVLLVFTVAGWIGMGFQVVLWTNLFLLVVLLPFMISGIGKNDRDFIGDILEELLDIVIEFTPSDSGSGSSYSSGGFSGGGGDFGGGGASGSW